MDNTAILALATGEVFEGVICGSQGTVAGELVFNTAISGYQEIITDPSYCRQIVTLTYPHIGNVGTNEDDNESSKPELSGLVIRAMSKIASNWRSELTLESFLKKHGVVAIAEIDTRHLTHLLREKGAISACISSELSPEEAIRKAKSFSGIKGVDLAKEVSTSKAFVWSNEGDYHVVAFDFGVKRNILKLLEAQNLKVTVVPAETSLESVMSLNPDGIFLSNGPGDPEAIPYAVNTTRELIKEGVPIFGICMGFQLLALALGAKTQKMKFGHHGANHPVIDCQTGKVLITSQNHGFMVDEMSLPSEVVVTHRSLFDDSLQGIAFKQLLGFQGHPEASPGPHDLRAIFNQFVNLIKANEKRRTLC
jgi:carbamoyl-phosphate synthase small subunit